MNFSMESLGDAHRRRWGGSGATVQAYRAPGRLILLGDHADYADGRTLAMALQLACYVTRSKNASGELRVISENVGEERRWPLSALPVVQPAGDWSDYVVGAAKELYRAGYPVEPANLRVESTLPMGAGLGSSTALTMATVLALLDGREIAEQDLIRVCRLAESRFAKRPTGVVDPIACLHGSQGALLDIDNRTMGATPVPWDRNTSLVAIDSGARHDVTRAIYRQRLAEAAQARQVVEGRSLRDLPAELRASLPGEIARRAEHWVSESDRVASFLAAETPSAQGELLQASHRSLRELIGVSCSELDTLVELVLGIDEVYGAKMTGAGSGGCTVNLIRAGAHAKFEEQVGLEFKKSYETQLRFFEVVPAGGAGRFCDSQ